MPVKDDYEREVVQPLPLSRSEENLGEIIEELQNQIARALIVPLYLLRGVHWSNQDA